MILKMHQILKQNFANTLGIIHLVRAQNFPQN